ncbi:SLAM family member 6 isoform X2 [Choloepus didactylus]|uniref:SLAM family member 6 isoform X2 n=1 Tax=Choloepus didactylus TaxID=27675 RepID=UPI00189E7EE8|nr:SLAM family member 6 isoform X2 [Choloepus didactylus]
MMWLLHSLMLVFCLGPGNAGSQSSSTPLMMNGILGETVTLPLKSPEGEEIKYITWLYNGMSIAFIKPSETGSPLIEVTDPKRRERLTFTPSYSLQLSNLTMADTGFYGAQITSKSSTTVSYYTLRIFRRLRKLQIDNHYVHFGNGTCEIHLTCSVENTNDSVSFTWHHLGKQISPSRELNITISLNPKNSSEHNYTCMAENPVSNLIISVSDQMYCKDNSFSKEKNQQLHIIWIMTVVPVICIMCWLLWKKRKGVFHFSTQQAQCPAEPPRTMEYASVSPGNTLYAQVYHPKKKTKIPKTMKKNESTTIYSTVQHCKESKSISSRATALDNII